MQRSSQAKNKSSHSLLQHAFDENKKSISYVEFQSKLLKYLATIQNKKLLLSDIFLDLANDRDFFKKNHDDVSLVVDWPHEKEIKQLEIKLVEDEINIFVEDKEIISLSVNDEEKILLVDSSDEWNKQDVTDLANHFNQIFRAKEICYLVENADEEEITETDTESHALNQHHYSREQFETMISENKSAILTTRINEIMVDPALRRGNKYSWHLDWQDGNKKSHDLLVQFTRGEPFRLSEEDDEFCSWVVTEKGLNKFPEYAPYKLKEGQLFYRLKVSEIDDENKSAVDGKNDIFDMWMTVDGAYGELHNVHKRKVLSGNEILDVYQCFDKLFKLKNTFIVDASNLAHKKDEFVIPLRLISALTTGKTWYENKIPGVKLFECYRFETAYNGTWTQNASERTKALTELQSMLMSDWLPMLNKKEKAKLRELCFSYYQATFPRLRVTRHDVYGWLLTDSLTLKQLVTYVYDESKVKRCVTPELKILVDLLTDKIELKSTGQIIDKQLPDYWVKSRVNEVLWGGYFWIKCARDEKAEQNRHNGAEVKMTKRHH